MAGATPEEAVDAFVERIRATLDCFLTGTAFGSGNAPGVDHSLTLYTAGQTFPNIARLSTHGGNGELLFRFAHLYTVVHLPQDAERGPYKVSTSFYQYQVLDIHERELVIYDWAPQGRGPVHAPHLHIPAVGSVILPQRPGSRLATTKTYFDDLHFPTGRIFLEDIAELLIREFRVDARRADWANVLRENRAAIDRGRTW